MVGTLEVLGADSASLDSEWFDHILDVEFLKVIVEVLDHADLFGLPFDCVVYALFGLDPGVLLVFQLVNRVVYMVVNINNIEMLLVDVVRGFIIIFDYTF